MARFDGFLGNGVDNVFDVDTGFTTDDAIARLIDTLRGDAQVVAFGFERQTPNPTSVRFTLTPAPATNQIQYFITDGTEEP